SRSMRRSLTCLSCLALGVVVGCGASKNTDDGNNPTNCLSNCNDGGFNPDIGAPDGFDNDAFVFQDISLDPSNATVYIDTGAAPAIPAKVTYKATLNTTPSKDVT